MAARSEPVLYHPTDALSVVPGAQAISEFFGFAADCGQAAAEVIYSWASGQAPSGEHINRVVSAMQNAGLAGSGGLSTLQGNSQALTAQGIPNYVTSDWMSAISQNVGQRPVEIGVANGRALPGDELNLNNHFLTIVGITKQGNLVASDPDNAAAKAGRLSTFTPQQIMNAQPFGAIVPTGQGASGSLGPLTSSWGIGSTAGSAPTPQDQFYIQAGQELGKINYNLPGWLWKGGLIFLGGLLILAGVIVFILPNRRDMNTAATVVAGTA